ncbi:hypothetical protein V8E53_014577 [Lactarius tabidus]
MTDSIRMIDTILHPEEQAFWRKLPNTYELAQLHRKFWVQGEYDKLLNVDEDEGDAEDDEVSPKCHVLDIGIPGLEWSKIWIRKEYIRMYQRCKDHFKPGLHNKFQSPSLVVTGQPGIGKRHWIIYVLCQRLAFKKPIMWYRDKRLYLFAEDGVYLAPTDYLSTEFRTRVWTLVDVDEGDRVPEFLAVHDTKHMIVFASSPKERRWKRLPKTTACAVAIMNPWTRAEISEVAAIHEFAASNSAIDEMYTRFGPTPRICFDYLKTPSLLDVHKEKFGLALSSLSLRSLREMVNKATVLDMDDVSHTILLLKRRGSLHRTLKTVEPITPAVEMALRNQFRRETRTERLNFYYYLANVEASRRLAGVVYESLVQETLQQLNTIELRLVPMVKRRPDGSGQGNKFPRYYSNHGDGEDPSSVLSINIHRTDNDEISSKPNPIKDKVYYALHNLNQAAVDSFIMDNNRLFIFQFTTASVQDINKGILTLFSQESLPLRENWYFIFVIPPVLSELSCPQPRDPELQVFLEKIHLCSVVVDPQP